MKDDAGSLYTMTTGVVFGDDIRYLSLLTFGEETVSLGSGVIQYQVQSLGMSWDAEPFLVPSLGRRHELDHGMCCLRFSHGVIRAIPGGYLT